jgi:hypothetical protein
VGSTRAIALSPRDYRACFFPSLTVQYSHAQLVMNGFLLLSDMKDLLSNGRTRQVELLRRTRELFVIFYVSKIVVVLKFTANEENASILML